MADNAGGSMQHTEYAFLTTDELLEFALLSQGRTSLEIELAQRLQRTVDLLEGSPEPFWEPAGTTRGGHHA